MWIGRRKKTISTSLSKILWWSSFIFLHEIQFKNNKENINQYERLEIGIHCHNNNGDIHEEQKEISFIQKK